jgi:hypothetical protein
MTGLKTIIIPSVNKQQKILQKYLLCKYKTDKMKKCFRLAVCRQYQARINFSFFVRQKSHDSGTVAPSNVFPHTGQIYH